MNIYKISEFKVKKLLLNSDDEMQNKKHRNRSNDVVVISKEARRKYIESHLPLKNERNEK